MKDKLTDVLHFENEALLHNVAERLERGMSVVLEVELYLGNGRWKLDKHRYKMIVPCLDNAGTLYSTDVFKKMEDAMSATYEIYRFTRQNATKLLCSVTPDLSDKRFGWGYTEEKYGRNPIKL